MAEKILAETDRSVIDGELSDSSFTEALAKILPGASPSTVVTNTSVALIDPAQGCCVVQ